jgi:hypothetical protein
MFRLARSRDPQSMFGRINQYSEAFRDYLDDFAPFGGHTTRSMAIDCCKMTVI